MKMLALDTSTEFCSVAVYDGSHWYDDTVRAGHTHSERILPMVEEALRTTGIALGQLDGIAFGAGPGSFTGLRIACGIAQGLAFGVDRLLIGISTLQAMAEGSGGNQVVVCLDARMHQVYHAAYQRQEGGWATLCEPALYAPRDVPSLDGNGWLGAGNGFSEYPALRDKYEANLSGLALDCIPRASAVGELALPVLRAGGGVAPYLAAPHYIREKVALTTAEKAPSLAPA